MWLPGRRGLRFSVRSKSARSRIQTSSKRRPKLLCDHEILEESIESVIGVGGHRLSGDREAWLAPNAIGARGVTSLSSHSVSPDRRPLSSRPLPPAGKWKKPVPEGPAHADDGFTASHCGLSGTGS